MLKEMNERLSQFLAAENISNSKFADVIGVARASISHILAGRNKPGYEFICSLMDNYPSLNIEWLLLGKGKMYKGAAIEKQVEEIMPVAQPKQQEQYDEDLFSSFNNEKAEMEPYFPAETEAPSENSILKKENKADSGSKVTENQRTVSKIIVFYSDNTFQELGV